LVLPDRSRPVLLEPSNSANTAELPNRDSKD